MRALLIFVLSAMAASAQHEHIGQPESDVTLYRGLGAWHHPVATKSPEAQKYFDQGLILLYAFNKHESAKSFQKAIDLDSSMPMAYWGLAAAYGPYINMDIDADYRIKDSCDAVARGLKVPNINATETRWLQAAQSRCPDFGDPIAYVTSMKSIATDFPDDPDAQTLYAEALMVPIRWRWYENGQPSTGEREAERVIEGVLRKYPQHPGANHLYIHAVESSPTPERAIPSAQRLMGISPMAGHMVHMPGHIWLVTGDYETAAEVNERAAQVDQELFARNGNHTAYYMYYLHNLTFITYARGMQGRVEEGNAASRDLQKAIKNVIREMPDAASMAGPAIEVLLRNRQWDEVLAALQPDTSAHPSLAFWHFYRALAFQGLSDEVRATEEQKKFEAERKLVDPQNQAGNNTSGPLLSLASAVVAARLSGAVGDWKKAVAIQDSLIYDEPPPFFYPVRESLGAALLRSGDPTAAEDIFREGLLKTPHNGRMLFGLLESLKAEHKTEAAAWVQREFDDAWSTATLTLRIEDL